MRVANGNYTHWVNSLDAQMSPSLGNRRLRVGELLYPLKALLTGDDHHCNSGAVMIVDALNVGALLVKDTDADVVIATSIPPKQHLFFEAVDCIDPPLLVKLFVKCYYHSTS